MGTQGDRSLLDAWAEMRYHVHYSMRTGGLYLGRNEKKAVFSFCLGLAIYNGWCKQDDWVELHQNPSYECINQGLAKWALATLELIHAMRVVMVEDELR